MKKIITLLFSITLLMHYVNLAANDYTTAHFKSVLCNFRFVLSDSDGFGWFPDYGIKITVDEIDYGFIYLPWATPSIEEIVPLPSGEVQLFWFGNFSISYHIEVYNSLDSLIYTSPADIGGLFFTYQNECVECFPITDFKGSYIAEEHQVNLSWQAPESADLIGFDIFRNDSLINHIPPSTILYSDNTTELEEGDYKYCVVPVFPSICDLDEKCFETYISNVGVVNYKDNIMIYPNPANTLINISGDRVLKVRMYNNMGQLILTQQNTNTINVSGLINGIYLLYAEVSTGQIIQKTVIINH